MLTCLIAPVKPTHAAPAIPSSKTTVAIDLPAGIAADVFTLAAPYRVIVDAPDAASFAIIPDRPASALVRSMSVAPGPTGGSRVLIETSGPVEVTAADWAEPGATANQPPHTARLILSMQPMDATAFGTGTGSSLSDASTTAFQPDLLPPDLTPTFVQATAGSVANSPVPVKPALFDDIPLPGMPSTTSKAKPVVMIDPGHGGIDPGAIGPGKITEKTIVLAVATQLKSILESDGRYDVRMTRSSDVFIPLDKRVAESKHAQADLFISLHADTIDNASLARSVRGASVYTLSDKASNEEARIMAEKENAADLIAGLPQHTPESGDDVKPILFDLMARETAVFSKLTVAFGRRRAEQKAPARP